MQFPLTDTNKGASLHQRIKIPRPGRVFVFTRTPGASYASVGVAYTCGGYPDNGYGDIYVQRVDKSSGTYDRLQAWEYAEWHYVDGVK